MHPSARGVSQGVSVTGVRGGLAQLWVRLRPQASPVRSCCCRPCCVSTLVPWPLTFAPSEQVVQSPTHLCRERALLHRGWQTRGAWSIPTTPALNEPGSNREMISHGFQRVKGQGSHTSLSFSFPECQGHSLLPLRPPVGSWGWRLGHEAPCGGSS